MIEEIIKQVPDFADFVIREEPEQIPEDIFLEEETSSEEETSNIFL